MSSSKLTVGIVGLPNAGKSTLFNALLKKQIAQTAAFPFCTIEPNTGIIPVPDSRLDKLAKISHSAQKIPAVLEFVDIAGIIKGAHQGKGLGNQFLSHIRETDLIVEVIRKFENKNVIHPEGKINPLSDQETIKLELIMADQQTVEKRIEKNKKDKDELDVLKRIYQQLDKGKPIRQLNLTAKQKEVLKDLCLLTTKPIIPVLNVSESEVSKQKDKDNHLFISAKLEEDLINLSKKEATSFLKDFGLKEPGLNKLIKQAYKKLNLITFFTSGPKETRAWTVTQGTKAPQAAGKIHSDFEKGFIKAEVISCKNFIKLGGEAKAREKGLIKTEGKNYLVQDGDCVEFLFR